VKINARPLLTEVIVNWNGGAAFENLLAEFPGAFARDAVGLTKNVGLAPALNRGAEIAAGSFLLLINNDIVGSVK